MKEENKKEEINEIKEHEKIEENKKETEQKKTKKGVRRKNPFTHSEVIFLVVITAVISIFTTYTIVRVSDTKSELGMSDDEKALQEFIDTYQNILDSYYEDVDSQELIDHAIAGMLSGLDDPYSIYFDEDSSSTFDATLEGSYNGVGLEVYNDTDMNIVVSRVFEGSSAEEAGIEAGDIIKEVDGKDLTGKATTEFSDYTKEKEDDEFQVVYLHDGEEKNATLKRKVIIIQSVTSEVLEENDKKIGYIQVDIFSATTYNQFEKAVQKLEKEQVEGMIIDLRDNTGGHLSVVTDMLSLFLDDSHIIYQIEDKDQTTKYYSTGKETKEYPVVILQNGNSASASELFTAAMKEEYGAKVVGTTSYGKGTVQELNTLQDGTQYKFTTKKWLTPKGNWVHEKGIAPDVEVELDEGYRNEPIRENDNQFQRAVSTLNDMIDGE